MRKRSLIGGTLVTLALVVSAGCGSSGTVRRAEAPTVTLHDAPPLRFRGTESPSPDKPGGCDCNNPLHWDGDTLYVFNSTSHPWRSAGRDLFHLDADYRKCEYDNKVNGGRWIECTWKAADGTLYGWYHLEPAGICPGVHPVAPGKNHLTAPRIGAVRSSDNGATWHDLGLILEAPAGSDRCDTKNFYFAGGNGDFSIMLDREGQWLYVFFSNYPADVTEQGVAVARMRWSDRDNPVGKAWKWHDGKWTEPGLGGRVTPIFPVARDWHGADPDAFWGPSIHFNTHLGGYVILLNRAEDPNWTEEGIYVTFNRSLDDPTAWTTPKRILDRAAGASWYPQVVGLDSSKRETDKLAGRRARLFIHGQSRWEIEFSRAGE